MATPGATRSTPTSTPCLGPTRTSASRAPRWPRMRSACGTLPLGPRVGFDGFGVEGGVGAGGGGGAEAVGGGVAAGGRAAGGLIGVVDDLLDGVGEGGRVAWAEGPAAVPVGHDVEQPAGGGGDHGRAGELAL